MTPKKRARILDKIRSGRATRIERLTLKQEGLCFYCWTDLDKDITKEHLDAKANGGGNESANLRAAHMLCNGIVGSLPIDVKLQLHEIGRDKGPEAFWIKAREYQQKFGPERNAYKRHKAGPPRRVLANANAHPSVEDARQLSAAAAELELEKLELGETLSRAQRAEVYQREVERRKVTGLPVQLGWRGWYRMMQARGYYGAGPVPCVAEAA